MKQLIKIDLKTIKKNKNHGETKTRVLLNSDIKFTCEFLPDLLIDGENCCLTEWNIYSSGKMSNISGFLFDETLINQLVNENKEKIKITKDFNYQDIIHFPIAKYDYEYENTFITCSECNSIFNFNHLSYDYDSVDDFLTDKRCPICGEYECCELEIEDIETAILRKKNGKETII